MCVNMSLEPASKVSDTTYLVFCSSFGSWRNKARRWIFQLFRLNCDQKGHFTQIRSYGVALSINLVFIGTENCIFFNLYLKAQLSSAVVLNAAAVSSLSRLKEPWVMRLFLRVPDYQRAFATAVMVDESA